MLLQENLLIKSSHNSFPCFAYSQGKKLWQPIPKGIKFMIKLANCIGNPSLNASNNHVRHSILIITQIPNLLSLGLCLGDPEREWDLDLELELLEWDLERLRDLEELLLDLDLDEEEDELLLPLRRFLLLGGEPDFDLERLKNRQFKNRWN